MVRNMAQNFSPAAFPGAPVRRTELEYLINSIQQGHCCAVVGPSNTGKSLLLKSLPLDEVRQHCARTGHKAPVIVFVDCLEAGNSEQSFYELMLRRTLEELVTSDVSASTVEGLRNLHREVLGANNEVFVRSLYSSGVRRLSREDDLQVVFILDEFYDVFRHLPPWPFRQLRALYDSLDTKICYITATSHHLEQLRSDVETYEFRELFHMHTLVLHPLTPAEAQTFVTYLADRQGTAISNENAVRLIEWSGGHPGLLERIFALLSTTASDMVSNPITLEPAALLQVRPIMKECRRLWSELEAEHDALFTLVEHGPERLTPGQNQLLEGKGLIVRDNNEPMIFSPLFALFVEQELLTRSETINRGLRCDFESGQIWVDDQEMTLQLSEPQRQLINYLYQRAGMVCTYDEIAIGVWGIGEGVSPGAIYELVKRVRQKIEPDWKQPRYIVTVPGKGYRLENTA